MRFFGYKLCVKFEVLSRTNNRTCLAIKPKRRWVQRVLPFFSPSTSFSSQRLAATTLLSVSHHHHRLSARNCMFAPAFCTPLLNQTPNAAPSSVVSLTLTPSSASAPFSSSTSELSRST